MDPDDPDEYYQMDDIRWIWDRSNCMMEMDIMDGSDGSDGCDQLDEMDHDPIWGGYGSVVDPITILDGSKMDPIRGDGGSVYDPDYGSDTWS